MHKENIRCTRCGKSETREINLEEVLKCFSCDEAIILKQAVTFGKRSDQEGAELSKLRDNLQRVILAEDDSSILKYSQDILTFIPNDYSALYYEAYVNNKSGQPKALHDFYESTNDEKTTKELENVVNHILTHFVLTHYNKANAFMKRESPQTCDELNRLYKERKQKEEDYAVVPRQVFICHKSEDFDVVRKVSDAIEKDGNKCWYSERNLRPNDGQNYWRNIEDAIDNATIFLVISSDIAMGSVDVQRELQYANKKNKKKIEYKIDDSVHTSLFKHSFDGMKWIDGHNSKELEVLKERVFELLNEKEPVKEEPKAENKSKLLNLIKKMYHHIEFEEYDEAKKIIKLIREDDFEQLDSWMGEFLMDYKLKDIESCKKMIQDISSLDKINTIKESKSFKALKKFDMDQQYRTIYEALDSSSEKLDKDLKDKTKDQNKEEIKNSVSMLKNKAIDKPKVIYDTEIKKSIPENIAPEIKKPLKDLEAKTSDKKLEQSIEYHASNDKSMLFVLAFLVIMSGLFTIGVSIFDDFWQYFAVLTIINSIFYIFFILTQFGSSFIYYFSKVATLFSIIFLVLSIFLFINIGPSLLTVIQSWKDLLSIFFGLLVFIVILVIFLKFYKLNIRKTYLFIGGYLYLQRIFDYSQTTMFFLDTIKLSVIFLGIWILSYDLFTPKNKLRFILFALIYVYIIFY